MTDPDFEALRAERNLAVRKGIQPPPSPELAGTWALLRGAWEWAERKHRRAE